MQDQVNNGGPAFPVSENYDERRGEPITYASEGMSLRDYFAAKALHALMRDYGRGVTDGKVARSDNFPATASGAAYAMADAMLKARGEM